MTVRKIIEQAVITLDGQISTPQNWLPTRWAGEFEQLSRDLLFSVDALLYGRVSYENHAEVWPTMEEAFGDDVLDAVRKLKEQPGGDILKVGTGGSFSRTLLEHGLVDEYLFWLFPVIAGSGERLYDGIDTTDFDLIDVKRLTNGVLGLTYVPTAR
jgi:hypothetical protein